LKKRHHRMVQRVSGVYNWRGTIGKTEGPDGSRMDVKGAIPDLDWINWVNRRVVIAYDARSVLAAHLRARGAFVGFLMLFPASTSAGR
jgi:hypothetical protein